MGEKSPAALWAILLLNELVLLKIVVMAQKVHFDHFYSFLIDVFLKIFFLHISITCILRAKSASVKALLSEEAKDGKRKVRKMII